MVSVKGGVVVTGIEEFDRMLRNMTPELNHRILGAANAHAAKPLIAAAKALAPQGRTGNLKKSIGAAKITQKMANEIGTVHVGPRRKNGNKGHHGHLVEFGAGPRKPGGWYAKWPNAHPTMMPKSPFMRPAFERTKNLLDQDRTLFIAMKLKDFMKRTLGKAFIK